MLLAGLVGAASAEDPVPYIEIPFESDTGWVSPTPASLAGDSHDLELVHTQIVETEGSAWVRVWFDQADLAPGAMVRVTSVMDGYEQTLDADALEKWSYSTAYFNGGAVTVDILAPSGSGPSKVVIGSVQAGVLSDPDADSITSICGSVDDRLPSYENRSARLMPIGCTAWLFNNRPNGMITAAHCAPGSGDVIQFHVPLSSTSGSTQNPPPEYQYPVDGSSVNRSSASLGNDYAVFGVFNNTTTGLGPVDAQLDSYVLGTEAPPPDGRSTRVTGYGSTSGAAPAAWYLFQKTHTGPLSSTSSNILRYAMDTSGGNSGSAVVDDTTGLTFGIHTNAGCGFSGGTNSGTSIDNTAFRNAIMQSRGVQAGPIGAVITTETLRPARINPEGGDTITVKVRPDFTSAAPLPGATMYVSDGSGYLEIPMTSLGGDAYLGTFPATSCGSEVSYYFSAVGADGVTVNYPPSAPSVTLKTKSSAPFTEFASFDFQTEGGWAVENSAISTGAWEIAVPTNPSTGAPHQDYDGSGSCWVTDNTSSADVDGGPTTLTSPVLDLSGATAPWVAVAAWVMNGGSGDDLFVQFSDDGGSTWVTAQKLSSTPGWEPLSYLVSDYVTPGPDFRIRFSISDNPNNSTVEAAVDALKVLDWACAAGPSPCGPADLAEPYGIMNIDDVLVFVDLFATGDPIADFNKDRLLNIDDILVFVDLFTAGCP